MSAKRLLAAILGAVVGAAVLVSPAAATPTVDCTTYDHNDWGVMSPGYDSLPFAYFWSEGKEAFFFCVDLPEGTEAVVQVREFENSTQTWSKVVATAPSGPGDKEFSYEAQQAAGYRLYVTAITGSGRYMTGITFGRNH